MREGFLQSHFSVYFVFIAVDRLPSLLKAACAFETVILHRFRIFLQKIYAVDDLEGRTGRIKALRNPVQQCTRLIVFKQSLPLFLNVVGIVIRFRDHREDPARPDLRHNDCAFITTHCIVTGFLDLGIERSDEVVAGIKFIFDVLLVVISYFF